MRNLSELKTLVSLSNCNFTKLTFEASVTTGFEKVAEEEVLEKFGFSSKVYSSRGRVFFNTNFDKYQIFRSLRSVDRVNILSGYTTVCLSGNPECKSDDLEVIQNTVKVFNWDKALTIWVESINFIGNVYPTKREYEEAVIGFDNKYSISEESRETLDEVTFISEKLNFEKTALEKALDSVISDSESDDEKINNLNSLKSKQIPRFRVTCNRVGQNHSFSSQEAATAFGGYLQDKFNWIVDLSNYDLEIILEINNEEVYAGIALNKMSNHFRNIKFFGVTTLRATICYNMLRLCNVQPGEFVIDPMCGSGSIPIEGGLAFPKIYFLGGDKNENAVIRTKCNTEALNNNLQIDSILWDATCLPLRENSVDVFVSDFPFGKRCGSIYNNKNLYKSALRELARTLRLSTGRCVILTADKSSLELAFQQTKLYWKQKKHLHVNIGGLNCSCFVLHRTNEEYELKLSRKEKKILAAKERLKKKIVETFEGINFVTELCFYN